MPRVNIPPYFFSALAAAVLGAGLTSAPRCGAQGTTDARFANRLAAPISATWRGQSLAQATHRLSSLYDVPVWLDRRVDPHLEVDLVVHDASLREAFEALAAQQALGATAFRGLVYVGSAATVGELATLAALARQAVLPLPAVKQKLWLRSSGISWPRLSEPRRLAAKLVADVGAELVNPELIPHDLWPQRDEAPLPTVDLLVLLLAGFDLTCEISTDGRTVRVAPIERPVQIAEDYRLSPRRATMVQSMLRDWPETREERLPSGYRLYARWEEHQQLRQFLQTSSGKAGTAQEANRARRGGEGLPNGRRVYTLRIVDKPLGAVLDQMANQLQLSIEWSAELDVESLRRRLVSCDVREVERHELLNAVLASADLAFRRRATGILVIRAE